MKDRRGDEAWEFLASVREAHFNAERARGKLRDMEAQCEKLSAQLSGAPGGGNDTHRDSAWAAAADQRCVWETLYAEAIRRETAVEQFIAKLPDMDHRMILRLRYVDRLRWPEVQKRMEIFGLYYSERQMYRLHGNALQAARALWREEKEGEAEK